MISMASLFLLHLQVGTMVTAAAENATTIQRLFYTEQFTLIQNLFTNYDFEPPVSCLSEA